MTGFLKCLAGVALGESGPNAAYASLPARFVPPAAALIERPHDQSLEDEATARSQSAQTELLHLPSHERGAPEPESPLEAHRSKTEFPRAASAIISSPQSLSPQRHFPSSLSASGIDIAPGHQASEVRPPSARDLPVAPSPVVAPYQTAVASRFDASTAGRTAVAPLLPMLPASRLGARAVPLSETAVASRMSAPRDERPAIHVTIDRIDVRASAPDKPGTAVRRPRPEPAVSLSEYLRRGAPGVRQ
jgi:hypothetical protein